MFKRTSWLPKYSAPMISTAEVRPLLNARAFDYCVSRISSDRYAKLFREAPSGNGASVP